MQGWSYLKQNIFGTNREHVYTKSDDPTNIIFLIITQENMTFTLTLKNNRCIPDLSSWETYVHVRLNYPNLNYIMHCSFNSSHKVFK